MVRGEGWRKNNGFDAPDEAVMARGGHTQKGGGQGRLTFYLFHMRALWVFFVPQMLLTEGGID